MIKQLEAPLIAAGLCFCVSPFISPATARAQPAAPDVVESIGGPQGAAADDTETIEAIGEPSTAPSPPAANSSSTDQERFSASAWGTLELHGSLNDGSSGPPEVSVPYDRAIGRARVFARVRYSRGRWFELSSSGFISYSYFLQGLSGRFTQDWTQRATRASFEPRLGEFYLGFFSSNVDLRLGQQRVAWGRADAQSPNDVLNARDMRDPLSPETDVQQVPTPLARVDIDMIFATLQLVGTPIFVPDYFDLYGSNWAMIQPSSPVGFRGFFHQMTSLVDSSLLDRFNRLVQQTRLPGPNLGALSGGAKLAITAGDLDMNFYYHYGFDRTPRLSLAGAFADNLARSDFARTTVADFSPFFASIQNGYPPLSLEYLRRHHLGLDAGTVIGPLGVRIDAAYDSARVFFRTDLTGGVSRTVQVTASFEAQTGDVRKVFVLEGSVLHLLDIDGKWLFVERDTFSATALIRLPLARVFDIELRAFATFEPWSVILRPQLRWRASDHLNLELAGLWLTGEVRSNGNYFARNTELSVSARVFL